jgi:periplasmic protein TonB
MSDISPLSPIRSYNSLVISLSLHIGLFLFFVLLYHQFYRPTIFEPVKTFSLISLPAPEQKTPAAPAVAPKKTQPVPQTITKAETTPIPAPEKSSASAAQANPDMSPAASAAPQPQATASTSGPAYDESKIVPVYRPEIEYPEVARSLGIEGKLVAIFTINSKGLVENVDILGSPHPSITRAAQKTLKEWRFKIGVQSPFGANARFVRRQEIEFKLNGEEE